MIKAIFKDHEEDKLVSKQEEDMNSNKIYGFANFNGYFGNYAPQGNFVVIKSYGQTRE